MAPNTFTFNHPILGDLTGILSPENVIQFRAIPYATISSRFTRSILLKDYSSINRDFTNHGFACPHVPNGTETDGGPFLGQSWPPPMDEFKCLILQINVPLAALIEGNTERQRLKDLPVMVYIHGGGFNSGQIDEQHNAAYMVEDSILSKQPVIGISIQYRHGAFGYLTVPDPNHTNLALHDQRNAFQWIHEFVSGFGGNPNEITTFGESAGAMSICYHMLSDVPLFRRVILMSGVIGPSTVPLSKEKALKLYELFLNELGISERGEAGLKAAKEADVQKVVNAASKLSQSGEMWLPVQDDAWFVGKGKVTWDRIPELLGACDWVESVVTGTTGFEGATMLRLAQVMTPTWFSDGIIRQLGPVQGRNLLSAYDVKPDMDQNLFLTSAMNWAGDIIFDGPNHALVKHLVQSKKKKVYRYIFDIRNPFPGHSLYQIAHHWVDVYFVFRTFQFRYPYQRLKNLSDHHARLWVDFANGKAPWREYKGTRPEDEIMVVEETDGWGERTHAQDEFMTERNLKRCEWLWDAFTEFKGREFEPLRIEPLEGIRIF